MRVIFLEDVPGTADAGEVKEVKNGFARNHLLPRGLAAPATPDALQRAGAIERAAQAKRVRESEDWQVVADALDGTRVVVEARVGPNGRLFGSVTGRHVAQKLSEMTGRDLDHRQVLLGEAIHDPGHYEVPIRLYRQVQTSVTLAVVPEGYVEPAAEEPADEEAAGESAPEPEAVAPAAETETEEGVESDAASEDPSESEQ